MELNNNIQMYRRVTQRTAVKMTTDTSYDARLHHLVGNMQHIEFESLLKCQITKKKYQKTH